MNTIKIEPALLNGTQGKAQDTECVFELSLDELGCVGGGLKLHDVSTSFLKITF